MAASGHCSSATGSGRASGDYREVVMVRRHGEGDWGRRLIQAAAQARPRFQLSAPLRLARPARRAGPATRVCQQQALHLKKNQGRLLQRPVSCRRALSQSSMQRPECAPFASAASMDTAFLSRAAQRHVRLHSRLLSLTRSRRGHFTTLVCLYRAPPGPCLPTLPPCR